MASTTDALHPSRYVVVPCLTTLSSAEYEYSSTCDSFNPSSTCKAWTCLLTGLDMLADGRLKHKLYEAGWMLPQRHDGWPVRVMRFVPAGLEALRGRARLSCHRWSTAARVVVASVAHPRACPDMPLVPLLSMTDHRTAPHQLAG